MTANDHHNPKTNVNSERCEPGEVRTLRELASFISSASTVSEKERPYLLSALKRAEALICKGAAEVKADPKAVFAELNALSPAAAEMSTQSFSNLKSRVRKAFRLATPKIAPARFPNRLAGVWKDINALLETSQNRVLSRFLRYLLISTQK